MQKYFNLILLLVASFSACQTDSKIKTPSLYLGSDLSYVNEIEDCGATFLSNNIEVEPYSFFAEQGANIARIRLWHTPDWTSYSTLEDVKKSIFRAKKNNMHVLLDFHYSDNWADPAHQIIPKIWSGITDTKVLGDSLFNYTTEVLEELYRENLLPELVQIGNETNSEIMMEKPTSENPDTDWNRNASLLRQGLRAVQEFNIKKGEHIQTMLHVAQPDNAKMWFQNVADKDLMNFDWIGLSYYPNWSEYSLADLEEMIAYLKATHHKKVMIVEAGYPYSTKNFDNAGNVLGEGANLEGYPVSPEGQLSFMIDLTCSVIKAGGQGVIYWEAAWVSSDCETQWGKGSHWENAAFFDAANNNEALPVFQFLNHDYSKTEAHKTY